MKTLYIIAMIVLGLFFRLSSQAQTGITTSFDKKEIVIGDQAKLTLSFKGSEGMQIYWPELKDTLVDKVEILEKSGIDTVYSEDRKSFTLSQLITVTSFDSGYYAIPPIGISYSRKGDTTMFRELSQAMLLSVQTLPVDTTKSIKDIKPVINARYTLREALPWIILFLALIATAWLAYRFIVKGKKALPAFRLPEKPKLPPHQIAMDALEELHRKKLWQAGHIKQYHTELTDIVRQYISDRFSIHAIEMTSDEISSAVSHLTIGSEAKEKLRQVLVLSDLVKFAKNQPLPTENELSFLAAVEFVKNTIHIIEANMAGIPNTIQGGSAQRNEPDEHTSEPLTDKQ